VLPLAVVVLISLFVFQSQGTERVAFIFGPVMLLWFVVMAVGGLMALVKNTVVLQAINPLEGIEFATLTPAAACRIIRPSSPSPCSKTRCSI
jgi:KUP system potassium uptake protein